MRWGPGTVEWLQELIEAEPDAAAAFGNRPSEIAASRPDVPEWAEYIAVAFRLLSGGRQWLVGLESAVALPIPWTAVDAYARRHGINGDAFDALVAGITAMDKTYLEDVNRKGSKPNADAG